MTGPDDESVAKMFDWVRMRIGFYGSTRAYWPVFAQHGLEELGKKLNHMAKTNQWDAMTGEVSDDVVHLFAAVGRHDELKGAIEQRFGGISDSISDSASPELEGTMPPDLIQDIQQYPDAVSRLLDRLSPPLAARTTHSVSSASLMARDRV